MICSATKFYAFPCGFSFTSPEPLDFLEDADYQKLCDLAMEELRKRIASGERLEFEIEEDFEIDREFGEDDPLDPKELKELIDEEDDEF